MVLPGVVWASSLFSGVGGAVGASVLDDAEGAVIESFLEGKESASVSLSVRTRSAMESLLYAETFVVYVPSSVNLGPSLIAGVFLLAEVGAPNPEVERLSVDSSSPKPVEICVGTASNNVEGTAGTNVAGSVDVAVQTEGRLYVSNEFHDYIEHCVRCNLLRVVVFVNFLCLR